MTTALITHPDCFDHVTPPGHPEQVARLDAVLTALDGMDLLPIKAPLAAEDDLLRVHPKDYLDMLRDDAPERGWRSLDADTHLSAGSLGAIWRAAGAVVRGVDVVMAGQARNAFAAVRPPGHHAEKDTAMGFCFLGNIAVAAKHALDHHGLSRVAIVDFDVHHGNGTQALVEDDPRILFISTHQMPLYPGTGMRSETGVDDNVLNIPLRPGTGSAEYRRIITETVIPRVEAFRPEMIFVSAGFDAHRADPLANINLEAEDYGWITTQLCDLADRVCGGRVVSALEGGYDLEALGASAAAHVLALRERA